MWVIKDMDHVRLAISEELLHIVDNIFKLGLSTTYIFHPNYSSYSRLQPQLLKHEQHLFLIKTSTPGV